MDQAGEEATLSLSVTDEMTKGQVATRLGVSEERVRQLAKAGTIKCRQEPAGRYTHLFFDPVDVEEYAIERASTKDAGSQVDHRQFADETLFLRRYVTLLQGQNERLREELTRARSASAAAEARIDELVRTQSRHEATIAALAETIKEASRGDADLGH